MIITYSISQLVPYINWVYYFYAWQVKEESEKQRMQREALAKLEELEEKYQVQYLKKQVILLQEKKRDQN